MAAEMKIWTARGYVTPRLSSAEADRRAADTAEERRLKYVVATVEDWYTAAPAYRTLKVTG